MSDTFLKRLENKVAQQLSSQHVCYLLGAGASYLNGKGYPLATHLWELISKDVQSPYREEIQKKIENGADGIEHALDLLDDGQPVEKPHRHIVTEAIAKHFLSISAPLDAHRSFVRRLQARNESSIPVFCLNYDGLLEKAADVERLRLIDGFDGCESPFFSPSKFLELFALPHRGLRRLQVSFRAGILHLYKLHGSLGWFELEDGDVRKLGFGSSTPAKAKRLMIPPQHRKALDTTAPPYSALWSDLRGFLCHGPKLCNRLVSIGYGLRDEHLNPIIENALIRKNFTFLVFAYELSENIFARWSSKKNVILVTKNRCSLYGEIGEGHPNHWDFERLSKEV
jgi:hypothetical protein